MKPEAQRIAIAQARNIIIQDEWGPLYHTSSGYVRDCPDYLNDLNAMHEAEKTLGQALYCRYIDKLCDQAIKGNNCMYFATAAQRAEAFLRTIGKWVSE